MAVLIHFPSQLPNPQRGLLWPRHGSGAWGCHNGETRAIRKPLAQSRAGKQTLNK